MQTNLEKLIEFGGWRPIEEAPKDGSEVLLTWSYLYPGDAHKTTGQGFYNWNVKDAYWEDEEGKHDPELFTHYTPSDAMERMAKVIEVLVDGLLMLGEVGQGAAPFQGIIFKNILKKANAIAGGTECK